ncbi:putative WD repeat-containing protein [Wickerhamomyces ciferrii]|uniref:WD repeat-containing protein n=1 Tax=Wickerhamomyces ciferrii (strain ATCC 14091 / BCRC 22168 / CBS 111 / JCM 3599 / NBRC 0793 / NRRL Y-1031 F-60-10) TaxID=1206466 RepID=K0KWE9_WICCF|nr:putative WD repeat-containing protein [Wickerhamomyces ciferrii]CCH46292.1 putative WD repeat-containing protein [Wickerhamomyces ciferrii]
MSNESRLSIDRIYGTSSNNQLNIATSTNLIAYIASGGVVVARIDKETGSLSSDQRFFCAYNASIGTNNNSNSANAYLNLIQPQQSQDERDQYGNLKLSNTITISNDTAVSNQLGDLSLNSSSPARQIQKIKAITCVAISPDEKLLAIGETGSQPRILIFSLAPDSNDFPILSLTEHNFGILALKFSPNSKYLLSVGVNHDSFLYLWKLNGPNTSIVGANRCTSQINGILWLDNQFVTYGIRHIKIWKFEEFETKSMIDGKNVILGDFLNGNFVYATGDDIDDLLLLSASGELCKYEPASNVLSVRHTFSEDDGIIGSVFKDSFNGKLWIGSDHIHSLDLGDFHAELTKNFDKSLESPTKAKFDPKISAIDQISEEYLIFLTSDEEIQLFETKTSQTRHLIDIVSKSISGVKIASNGQLVSWTKEGVVKVINKETLDISLLANVIIEELPNKVISNHVTALDLTQDGGVIVGDAYGTISIFDSDSKLVFSTPSHEFTINGLTYFTIDKFEIIVSIGRDRMIQVLAKRIENEDGSKDEVPENDEITYEWSVFQTLDDHRGNLLNLKYNDNKIFVSSADRSISIHNFNIDPEQGLVITKEKTISVKSSPLAMTLHKGDLIIATNDKNITVYNGETYESTKSFKLYDHDNETLLIDNLQITQDNLLICSCSDKSIRAFNFLNNKQVSVNYGHSESISELVLVSPTHLISLSNSGCLFAWSLHSKQQQQQNSQDSNPKGTIQKYNELATPPKVTRKIKKPTSITPLSKRQPISPSIPRSPINSRLQSTTRMTPSKLSSSTKTNLSPSTPKSSPRPVSPRLISSPSTPTTVKQNHRSSIMVNSKTRLSEQQGKIKVEEVISNLKRFKENIEEYSLEDVELVKREINEIFDTEEQLLIKYNSQIIGKMCDLFQNKENVNPNTTK